MPVEGEAPATPTHARTAAAESESPRTAKSPRTPVLRKPAASPKAPKKTSHEAKSKASPKKKGKTAATLKKPAGNVIKTPQLKKPAADVKGGKQGSSKNAVPKVEDWAVGIEPMEVDLTAEQGEEEALQEDDPVQEVDHFETDQNKKDKVKDAKFKKMYDNHDLPDYVMKAYAKTLQMKTGRTQKQRELINACFDRVGGSLQLSLDKPLFKQYQVVTLVLI